MMKRVIFAFSLLVTMANSLCCNSAANGGFSTVTDFEFISGGKTLSGIIDQPSEQNAKALIIIVHGSGPSDIRGASNYSGLRGHFSKLGITCVTWDKPGTGRSQGKFDADLDPGISAQEILDAISYLQKANIPGSSKIGIWSISSGGWIAPIAISRSSSIRFCMSVSGVPAADNKYYLLKSNLPLEGRTPEETQRLLNEWKRGREILMTGGNYQAYLSATENLRRDTSVLYFAGDLTGSQETFEAAQKEYFSAKDNYEFDEDLSLIRVRHMDRILRGLNIDMLAIFGEKDTNVDWRKTLALYEFSIRRNPNASLIIQTFPNANHNMNISATGSVREVEGMAVGAGVITENYYETQISWLRKYVLSK